MEKSSPTCSWNQSQWLQSTLTELDEKTKAMLTLIQQDGDSFTHKRPELVKMVEEFHRSYRYLAERVNQLKFESVLSQSSSSSSSSSSKQFQYNPIPIQNSKLISYPVSPSSDPESVVEHPKLEGKLPKQSPNSPTETKREDPNSIFVDDLKHMAGIRKLESDLKDAGGFIITEKGCPNSNSVDGNQKKRLGPEIVNWEIGSLGCGDHSIEEKELDIFLEREQMWAELRLQVSKLVEENVKQQEELIRRNEEKRELIKSLSSEVEKLMDENRALQKCLQYPSIGNKQKNPLQISKSKGNFLTKIWGKWSKN